VAKKDLTISILFHPWTEELVSFSCKTQLAVRAAVKFAIVRDPVLTLANLTFDIKLAAYAVGHSQ
jgi:hypothetical protein